MTKEQPVPNRQFFDEYWEAYWDENISGGHGSFRASPLSPWYLVSGVIG
jgi:hypothetical protein